MSDNLDTLRKTVENAGEAWADGEHIDIITPTVVLELIERAEAAERALDFHSQRDRELKTLLSMISDRLDEFCYDELSSLIEDSPLDQWGETYKSRLEQAEQQVARVRAMAEEMGEAIGFDRLVHGSEAEYPVSYFRDKLEEALDGESNE